MPAASTRFCIIRAETRLFFLELLQRGFHPANLRHLAISEDAAAPLRELDLPRIEIAAQPDEDLLLAGLA